MLTPPNSTRRVFFLPALVLCLFAGAMNSPVAYGKNLALVIGNASYAESPLKNPVNDAQDMARALRELGFEVMEHVNTDRIQMHRAIREFGTQLARAEIGLFYYAGHGMQVEGRNYLIPLGVDIQSEDDIKFESIDVGRVLAKMEWAQNPVNIIVLDACRNNPFERGFRSAERGLARVESPVGSLLLYATAPDMTAADGDGDNGVFTGSLIKQLSRPGLTLDEVVLNTRIDVMEQTQQKQVPWSSSSLTRKVVLLPTEQPAVVEQPAAVGAGNTASMLRICNTHLEANRLTSGVGGTALDCFQSVLTVDPFNIDALNGIDQITQIYIKRARSALQRGRTDATTRYIDTLRRINPEHPVLDELDVALVEMESGAATGKSDQGISQSVSSIPDLEQSPLMGNWQGFVSSKVWGPEVRLQIAEQDGQTLRGHAAISGSELSCKDSKVELIPGAANSFAVTFAGGGCNGKGEFKLEGDTLWGDVKFSGLYSEEEVELVKISESTVEAKGVTELNTPDGVEIAAAGSSTVPLAGAESAEQSEQIAVAAPADAAPEPDVRETDTSESANEPDEESAEVEVAAIEQPAAPRTICPDCNLPTNRKGKACIELAVLPSKLVPAEGSACLTENTDQCVDNQYRFMVRNICKKPMFVEWELQIGGGAQFESAVLKKADEKLITCLKQQQACDGTIRYAWKRSK